MFKYISLLKRKEGTTMEEFKKYYEENHTLLTRRLTPEMRGYTRNYLEPVDISISAAGDSPFDCVTEVIFDSRADFDRVVERLRANPDQAHLFIEDEENFLDRSKVWWFTSEQATSQL